MAYQAPKTPVTNTLLRMKNLSKFFFLSLKNPCQFTKNEKSR